MHSIRCALNKVADGLGTESYPIFEILRTGILARCGGTGFDDIVKEIKVGDSQILFKLLLCIVGYIRREIVEAASGPGRCRPHRIEQGQ